MTKSKSVSGAAEAPRLIRSTTVLCVRRDNKVVMAGDGQVTLGESVIKHGAKKIRRLYQDKILAGFAGQHCRRLHPLQPLRSKAGAVSRQPRTLRRRTGQRLAHRQISPPPRSPAAGERQRPNVSSKRPGRRNRARHRHSRHRQRRPIRPSRRASTSRPHETVAPRDRRRINEDCRQNVHLYQ